MSETDDPTPILAFDIVGTHAAQAADTAPYGPEGGYRWLHFDIADPALDAWAEANLPVFAARTLLVANARPRVDADESGAVSLVVRGMNMNPGEDSTDMVSLRIWATADLVVTVRRQRVFVMDDIAAQARAGDPPPTPARLIARITEMMVDRLEAVSLDLDDRADTVEDEVYDRDLPPSYPLAPMRRTAIKLRRHVAPLTDTLTTLARVESPVIPPEMRLRLRSNANRARRSLDELSEVQERLATVDDHIEMIQQARLARNGYLISVVAAIFLPLSFLTGLFGVNLAGMPGADHPMGFAILCLAMLVLGVGLYALLRLIRWF